jgi:siderophore ferric iron reductase
MAAPMPAAIVEGGSPCRLRGLFDAGAAFVPGMTGALGGHGDGHVTPGRDNSAEIAGLVDALGRAHPEAGRGFQALRAWGMLTWQPAVLAIVSVHMLGVAPRHLDAISQRVQGGSVLGYRLPGDALDEEEIPALVACAGRRLRALADGLLAELGAVIPMKPLLAERLLADRVLGLLPHLGRQGPRLANEQIRHIDAMWLAAMRLEGRSGLLAIALGDGREQLPLDRKACCLEYRLEAGSHCASCPKLDAATRTGRLRAHWEAQG